MAPGIPRYIRWIMLFDLLACGLFALPGVSAWVIELIGELNAALSLPGSAIEISPSAYFFVNFAGLLGVAFNIALLRTSEAKPHWVNVIARGGVALLLAYHIGFSDVPAIFAAFIVTEIAGGIATIRWLNGAAHAG